MKRKLTDKLKYWKTHQSKMPLMLLGARQVGKTYTLTEFCSNAFEEYVYINLEQDDDVRQVFETSIKPKDIIDSISIIKNRKIDISKTVIFIDEIQVSERAITSLKYFNEANEAYRIVCAGSMLGIALNRFKNSFPVGKVYRLHMYPMDFEEYLWGIGETLLAEKIAEHYISNEQLIFPLHQKALKLYKEYLYVGGMPASINEFVSKEKMLSQYDDIIKQSIVEDYIVDMSKYTTSSENLKINKLYKSIPKQLGRDNNKFSYKLVEEKSNKRTFETALEWLDHSFIINKCTFVDLPEIPLKAYEKENYFKIYTSDVGILAQLSGFSKQDLYSDELKLFSGMLTENYVANMLTSNTLNLHYWKSKHNAEIDFLVNIEGHIIPVEVKASTNTKSKSLKVYVEQYEPKYAIRVSGKNFGFVNKIKSVPLYAVHMIR